ncbi:hypothetical protein ACIOKD_14400 [Streptomyces sp. NPDC087844]|uniref:zinc finger domain-containing protein n=1 Tax=Streptomyces sp. NPDC087844 TaxID=3365805 RepID=UPI00381A2E9C
MNPKEAVLLTRYVKALCPQQQFDEYTADAWHDVMGSYSLVAARAAAAAVARRQPWVSPAEMIDEITAQRSDAAADIQGPGLPAEIPDADPDDVPAYLAAVKEQRTRAADGQLLTRRPVAELIVSVKAALPTADGAIATVRRPGPLGIACPQCKAAIGYACKTPAVEGRAPREREPHAARKTAATGGPVIDRATARADEEQRRAQYLRQLEQMQESAT